MALCFNNVTRTNIFVVIPFTFKPLIRNQLGLHWNSIITQGLHID